ncbi:hypothetical protein GOBAR_AA39671 [Gossypium barbadense]|uniref:Uncharacterized protein n=1 Tax=Gossypium barbadense TaxID=3634 RepID=A0A2P5VQF4_GOSBA|nr:hypothetical protein GOBAR_AA39671 [Gossypium barbadense]
MCSLVLMISSRGACEFAYTGKLISLAKGRRNDSTSRTRLIVGELVFRTNGTICVLNSSLPDMGKSNDEN